MIFANLKEIIINYNLKIKLILIAGLFGIMFLSCSFHLYEIYDDYWGAEHKYGNDQGTIYAVQTVENNIAAAGYPFNISQLLRDGDYKKIQEYMDSSYSFLGFVVTGCESGSDKATCINERIIAKSSYQWLLEDVEGFIKKSNYNIITTLHSAGIDWHYKSPKMDTVVEQAFEPQGDVIGRIYYVRKPRPEFLSQIVSFVVDDKLLSHSSDKKHYLLVILVYLLAWIIFSFLIVNFLTFLKDSLLTQKEKRIIEGKCNDLELEIQNLKPLFNEYEDNIRNLKNSIDIFELSLADTEESKKISKAKSLS